jgi:hypothetical protein
MPLNGFHSPTVEQPIPCKEAARGITYRPERVANARLIAAAPDLLEACKEAVLQIEYLHAKFQATGSGEATVSRLRAAIAKAEGDK